MTEQTRKRLAEGKALGGRPLVYETPEALDKAIQKYFDNPKKRSLVVGKGDNAKVIEIPVLTISGLVLSLGFADRCSFYEYEKRAEFTYTIKRARERIVEEYESLLQQGLGAGAIFALKQFGWKDEPAMVIENHTHFTSINIDNLKPEELVDLAMGRYNGRQNTKQLS